MREAIERWCAALAALGYDPDRLAEIENALRYQAALQRGREVRR